MNPDQELCLCFHVSIRKVQKFIRLEKPKVASQLSQCFGAGTGCGWCRPFLKRLLEEAQSEAGDRPANLASQTASPTHGLQTAKSHQFPLKSLERLDPEEYARLRQQYVRQGKNQPPQ